MLKSEMTVLVVEDQEPVRMVVAYILRKMGFTKILEAADFLQGQQMIRENRPDLLIADGNLPGGGHGLELIKMAQDLYPEIKLLFMTGSAEHNLSIHQGLIDTMGDFPKLFKPFDGTRLKEAVEGCLNASSRLATAA